MCKETIVDFIDKAVSDAAFRQAFRENPDQATAEHGIDLSDDVMQSLLTLTEQDFQDIGDHKLVEKERLRVCRSVDPLDDVEVICACGAGYWAQ